MLQLQLKDNQNHTAMLYAISHRTIEEILKSSLKENAIETSAKMFNLLASEYIEGENDNAGELFNKYFPTTRLDVKIRFSYTTPFRRFANEIARNNGFKEPWIERGKGPWEWIANEVL